MERGTVQVYYGNGDGKSSAALGYAIRWASKGDTAYMIQFLKGQPESDFITRLEPELKFFRFERSPVAFDDMTEEEREEEKKHIRNGLNFARKALGTGECDLLVLDEVLGAIEEGILEEEELLGVLSQRTETTTVILTGRNLPSRVAEAADRVMDITKEK